MTYDDGGISRAFEYVGVATQKATERSVENVKHVKRDLGQKKTVVPHIPVKEIDGDSGHARYSND